MKRHSKTFIKSVLFTFLIISLVYSTKLFGPPKYLTIRIVGSTITFPFITYISEEISKKNLHTNIVIEKTGTGSGFQLFCQKNHPNSQPDIVAASRAITTKELNLCKQNGISPQELIFGYDAMLVLSTGKNIHNLSREGLFSALAEFIPSNHSLIRNNNIYWNNINSSLPEQLIEIYGPSYSSGTRTEINNLVMEYSCKKNNFSKKYLTKSLCISIRRDGQYIELGDKENLTIQKLKSNPNAIGILGYNFYIGNKELNLISIDGIYPDLNNITTFKYPLTRPLYLYFDAKNRKTLNNFMLELTKDEIFAQDSHLTKIGLIPLKPEKIKNFNQIILSLIK